MTAPNPRDAYDRWAAQCDTDANDTRDLNAEVLREQTVIEEDDAVLGLGRGTGLNTEWLATRVGHVVTTDVCDEMPARARGRLTPDSGTLQTLDVTTPRPFEAGRFDAVVATLVLEHMEEPAPVFQEARRVLREGDTSYLAELHPTRQLGGTQAHFEDEATGETVVIDAFLHPVSEFVTAGVEAGFAVREMGEWRAATRGRGCCPFVLGRGPARQARDDGIPGAVERGGAQQCRDTLGLRSVGENAYFDTDL